MPKVERAIAGLKSRRCSALLAKGMAETDSAAIRRHLLAALMRRRELLPAAARELVDVRIEQLRSQSLAQTTERASRMTATSPLAELVLEIDARTLKEGTEEDGTAPHDLKSVGYFRDRLCEFKVERQIEVALAQRPENAGPLNSHLLAVRALDALRSSAPPYLRHFVSYLDTLGWLDGVQEKTAATSARNRGRKKR
jgi:hypothetical protein